MNPYITAKVHIHYTIWQKVLMVFWGCYTVFFTITTVLPTSEKEVIPLGILISAEIVLILITGIGVWRFLRIVYHRKMSLLAVRLAEQFSVSEEYRFSIRELERDMQINNLGRKLHVLISGKYLQQVKVDEVSQEVVLTAGKSEGKSVARRVIICPACGAENVVYSSENDIIRCQYCNSPLREKQTGE